MGLSVSTLRRVLLKDTRVNTSQRLNEVFVLLEKYHFKVKLLKFVYDENKEYSNVFMVKATKHGLDGMFVEKPIIIKR